MTTFALAVCVAFMAWLTAGAMAVRSASRIWLRHWAERRLHGADTVLAYLERPQRLITAANLLMALTLTVAGAVIGFRSAGRQQELAMLELSSYAALMIVAGQLIPRAVARRWPSAMIPVGMPVLRLADALAMPLLAAGRLIGGRRAVEPAGPPDAHAAMATLLREGELEGVGKREENAIISGVMQFAERRMSDVMTPRAEVFAVADDVEPRKLAPMIAECGFSRVPVYHGTLDNIIGIYHAFDLINEGIDRRPRLRPVVIAPPDAKCNEFLFRMLRQRIHLAVVQDAGRTLGIATLENLLEELVGDIRDEHDEPAARPARTA